MYCLASEKIAMKIFPPIIIFLVVSVSFNCAGGFSMQSPQDKDLLDIYEIAFKKLAHSDLCETGVIFLEMPGGKDPDEQFMSRFRGYSPAAYISSLATRTETPARQVIHKITKQPGVIIGVRKADWISRNRVEVTIAYDKFSLGGGTYLYILERDGNSWKIVGEKLELVF
jgi:hypothetical protein